MVARAGTTSEAGKSIIVGIAVTSLMLAGAMYMRVFGSALTLFIPLPILYYRARLGRHHGGMVLAATALILAALSGTTAKGAGADAVFFMGLLVLGFMLQEFLEQGLSIEKTVGYTAGTVLLTWAAVIWFGQDTAKDVYAAICGQLSENVDVWIQHLRQSGRLSGQEIDLLAEAKPKLIHLSAVFIIGLACSWIIFVTWVNLLAARPLLKIKGLYYPDFGPFSHWKAPEHLVWVAIGCFAGLMIFTGLFQDVILVGAVVTGAIYIFCGIAIIAYYFEKIQVPRLFVILIAGFAIITLWPLLFLPVIGLGFFDLWADFRRLKTKSLTEDQE